MNDRNASAGPPLVGRLLGQVMERLELRGSEDAKPVPLPWPTAEIVFAGGLWPGLHLLVAAGGAGKTQLAAQLAKHASTHKTPTLYFSLELDAATQIVARWLALEAGLAWSDVYLGRLEREDRVNLAAAEASLDELPLHFHHVEPERFDAQAIESAFTSMRAAHPEQGAVGPTMLVIVDGISVGFDLKDERLELICRNIARAAMRNNAAAFVLLRQPEREAIAPGEGDPLRFLDPHVDRLGTVATSVSALIRPAHDGEEAFLGVARHRYGRPGWVELLFDGTEFGGGFDS